MLTVMCPGPTGDIRNSFAWESRPHGLRRKSTVKSA